MEKRTIPMLLLLCLGFSGIFFYGCEGSGERMVDLSFTLNEKEDYSRSDQLVIWLEKPDGSFVKSLYVSEYLSYGGYNDPDICPDWSSNTDWEMASQEEFDAVTGATPAIGAVNMQFSLSADEVPKGEYIIFLAVHLIEDYHEIYQRKIKISRKGDKGKLELSHKPGKYHGATYDVLSEVLVKVY